MYRHINRNSFRHCNDASSFYHSEERNPTLCAVLTVGEESQDKSGDPSVALLLQDDAMRQIASSLSSSRRHSCVVIPNISHGLNTVPREESQIDLFAIVRDDVETL